MVANEKIIRRHGVPAKNSLIENFSWGSITSGLFIGGWMAAGRGSGIG
jgi:hypothetical protein